MCRIYMYIYSVAREQHRGVDPRFMKYKRVLDVECTPVMCTFRLPNVGLDTCLVCVSFKKALQIIRAPRYGPGPFYTRSVNRTPEPYDLSRQY